MADGGTVEQGVLWVVGASDVLAGLPINRRLRRGGGNTPRLALLGDVDRLRDRRRKPQSAERQRIARTRRVDAQVVEQRYPVCGDLSRGALQCRPRRSRACRYLDGDRRIRRRDRLAGRVLHCDLDGLDIRVHRLVGRLRGDYEPRGGKAWGHSRESAAAVVTGQERQQEQWT